MTVTGCTVNVSGLGEMTIPGATAPMPSGWLIGTLINGAALTQNSNTNKTSAPNVKDAVGGSVTITAD